MSKKEFDESVQDGQNIYNPWVLRMYDLIVTYTSNSFIWQCSARHMTAQYNQYISHNHLDIGVGSGYYLKKVPNKLDKLALMDLNENSIQHTIKRLKKEDITSYNHNVFEEFPESCNGFDSIGINYLLHCLPGTFETEKKDVIANSTKALNPGGVLFGATIINIDDKTSTIAKKLMSIYNKKGIFHNTKDTQQSLESALSVYLENINTKRIGNVVLFSGNKPL